jgi:phosphoenolpyruvate synthase/pyruvate phosphate dikinase
MTQKRSDSTPFASDDVRLFSDISCADVAIAGGKGANFGELIRAGQQVPPGFVVTAPAYLSALDAKRIRTKLLDGSSGATSDDTDVLEERADLQHLMIRQAGINESFTNVSGEEELFKRIVDCWASDRAEELSTLPVDGLGLLRAELLKWIMAEVPSVIYRIPEYTKLGINKICIRSNDLTQLMLGVDHNSAMCAELFDESDDAVMWAIEQKNAMTSTAPMSSTMAALRHRGSRRHAHDGALLAHSSSSGADLRVQGR